MQAYEAALAGGANAPPEIGSSRSKPGTIDALAVVYYRSANWSGLDRETQKSRRRIIERFRAQHGAKRVALLQRDHIEKMLAKIEKPAAKFRWLKAIRGLMKSAVPGMRKDNPADGTTGVRPKTEPHHTGMDQRSSNIAHWPLGTQQRLVLEFALETASRRCEMVRLGPQHVKDRRIRIERAKGSRNVKILVTPELQAACDAMQKGHLTYIATAWGKPRSRHGPGNDFARCTTVAGLPARCRLHGLNKASMTRLAESGTTTYELMAISGHKTLSQVALYTEEADRKKLANAGMAERLRGVTRRTPSLQTLPPRRHKPSANSLKLRDLKNGVRFHPRTRKGPIFEQPLRFPTCEAYPQRTVYK
jgi:hypothetical protein